MCFAKRATLLPEHSATIWALLEAEEEESLCVVGSEGFCSDFPSGGGWISGFSRQVALFACVSPSRGAGSSYKLQLIARNLDLVSEAEIQDRAHLQTLHYCGK